MTFVHDSKVTRISNAVAAGTTDVEPSTGIDAANFETTVFVFLFGAITAGAVTVCKAQQSTEVDGATDDFDDIEGSAIAVADDDDNQVVLLEVKNPTKRYVRPVIDRGTQNAAVDGIIAIQTGARVKPVTHDATTVVGAELHEAKAEGTA